MPDINIAQILIAFVVLLLSLTVHEAAHAWTADRLGDPTARMLGRVSFNPVVHADLVGTVLFPLIAMVSNVPLIGWAKPVPVSVARLRRGRTDFMLVAAAGPASNLLIAVAASLVLRLAIRTPLDGIAPGGVHLSDVLVRAMALNVMLAVFNMLPIPPLDGGNVLAGLLPRPLAAAFDQLRPYGFILIYALLLTGGFDTIVMPPALWLASWLY